MQLQFVKYSQYVKNTREDILCRHSEVKIDQACTTVSFELEQADVILDGYVM